MKSSESKIRSCFLVFVNLEKAFDQVSREVIYFTLRWKGDGELSNSFSVKVGVHQG